MVRVDWQLQQADKAWLALAGVIVAIELAVDDDQMLSHGAARYRAAHPVVTTAVVLTTAFHLLSWLPARQDPFHALFRLLRRTRPASPDPYP